MSLTHQFTVAEKQQGKRLDAYLASVVPDLSRSRIKVLIEAGHARKSGQSIDDCAYRVKSGDMIELDVPPAEPSDMRANTEIPLDIAYEDAEFLIINKQAGLTVHPGAGNHSETMANALMAYCGDELSGVGGVSRPGIVHRLDKDTSGLIMVAKTDRAHVRLSEQIAARTMERTYTAFCWGVPKPHSGTVDANIDRNPKHRLKMAVVPEGRKTAITHYKVTKIYGGGMASKIECRLQTGRTHQIRVHMTHLGHPLIGDPLYGSRNFKNTRGLGEELREFLSLFNRQALHSSHVGVEHPVTGDYISVDSDLPDDLKMLEKLLIDLK